MMDENIDTLNNSDESACKCKEEKINDSTKTPDKIIYSEGGSKAARHSTGVFFTLDPETKLPIPLDKGGFFRMKNSSFYDSCLVVEYRIERKFFKRFNLTWLSSRYIHEIFIDGSVREIVYEDILYKTLELSERRKLKLKAENWVGKYPPKEALSVTDEVK